MPIDITDIVVSLVGLAFLILTGYLIPYIKSKTSVDQWATIQFWTKIAVHAAEQIYKGSGLGETKKKYVEQFLNNMFTIDEAKLDNVIESEVHNLNQALSDQGA